MLNEFDFIDIERQISSLQRDHTAYRFELWQMQMKKRVDGVPNDFAIEFNQEQFDKLRLRIKKIDMHIQELRGKIGANKEAEASAKNPKML